jgi:restriction endonuclease S subunit
MSMWPSVSLRRVFAIVNGGTPTSEPENWGGNVPWATPVDLGRCGAVLGATERTITELGLRYGSRSVPTGSVMLSTRAPIGYVARTQATTAFNQGCKGLVPHDIAKVDVRYFAYQLISLGRTLQSRGQGSTFLELSSDALAQIRVTVPAPDEQRRIADFLDAETTRIDRLVDLRRIQLQLQDERVLAAIADVLAGRSSHEKRRTTGLPWLPSVPESWTLGPVYAYFDVRLGKMLNPERAAGDHPRPYLRNANVHWFDLTTEDLAVMSFEPNERLRYRLDPGDLVVCEGGAGVAEAAVWRGAVEECYYQKSLHRVRARGHLPVEWLMFWLRLAKASGVFASDGNLATIPHLTCEQLREYRVPVPPPGAGLLSSLQQELALIAGRLKLLERSIELLAERRQALITAAVTGVLDVATARGAA